MKNTLVFLMLVIMSQVAYSQFNTESKEYNKRDIIKYTEGTKEYQAIKEQVDMNVDILVENIILTVNSSIVKSNMLLDNPKTYPNSNCPFISVIAKGDTSGYINPYAFPRIVMINYMFQCENDVKDINFGMILSVVTNDRDIIGAEMTNIFIDYYWNNIKVDGTLKMKVAKIDDRQGKSATLHYESTYDLTLTVNGSMSYKYSGERYKVVRK